jgi:hypothetical protein
VLHWFLFERWLIIFTLVPSLSWLTSLWHFFRHPLCCFLFPVFFTSARLLVPKPPLLHCVTSGLHAGTGGGNTAYHFLNHCQCFIGFCTTALRFHATISILASFSNFVHRCKPADCMSLRRHLCSSICASGLVGVLSPSVYAQPVMRSQWTKSKKRKRTT